MKKTVDAENEMIVLKSPYLYRLFQNQSKAFCTVAFQSQPDGTNLIGSATENEGVVTINGTRYVLGGNQENSIPYRSHTLTELEENGCRLEVVFDDAPGLPDGLTVKLLYEALGSVPVLIKSIRIENESQVGVHLDGVQVEAFTPTVADTVSLMLENDYVRDAMTINGKRARSPWIEQQSVYVDALLNTKAEPTRFAYPVKMDKWLVSGFRFNSFRVYEFVITNKNEELRGLTFRQATRKMFPWTRFRSLSFGIAPAKKVEAYYKAIELAAEAGYESVTLLHGWIDGKLTSPLFTNYNDYVLKPEFFPNGWNDVRGLTEFAHSKGLTIAFYAIYVETWRGVEEAPDAHRNNRWELIWDANDTSERWGIALDPATDWGLFVNRKLEEAIVMGGFDGCHLDGPYYGDINVSKDCGVRPGGPNQLLAWERQVEFYQRMRGLGIQCEAAQGFCAYPHGMSRVTTTGYDEADFGSKGMRQQILSTRLGAYSFTKVYRPEQATTFIPVAAWSDKADAPCLEPMEEHVALLNSYMANCYGYGFEGKCFAHFPYDGPKSKAVVLRWLNFWKEHQAFFKSGYLVHLRQPDGNRIDGVMHILNENGFRRALVVVYNPVDTELNETLDLRFSILDWPKEGWSAISESGKRQEVKKGRIEVAVPAQNATWYIMKCAFKE